MRRFAGGSGNRLLREASGLFSFVAMFHAYKNIQKLQRGLGWRRRRKVVVEGRDAS